MFRKKLGRFGTSEKQSISLKIILPVFQSIGSVGRASSRAFAHFRRMFGSRPELCCEAEGV
jgi:hypothetical protein